MADRTTRPDDDGIQPTVDPYLRGKEISGAKTDVHMTSSARVCSASLSFLFFSFLSFYSRPTLPVLSYRLKAVCYQIVSMGPYLISISTQRGLTSYRCNDADL